MKLKIRALTEHKEEQLAYQMMHDQAQARGAATEVRSSQDPVDFRLPEHLLRKVDQTEDSSATLNQNPEESNPEASASALALALEPVRDRPAVWVQALNWNPAEGAAHADPKGQTYEHLRPEAD